MTTAQGSTPNKEPSGAQKLIGDFAPKLVELTDDVLFGDVWARPELVPRDRRIINQLAHPSHREIAPVSVL
jgi:4-carboxymuconolactone decarboxylase